PDPAIFGEARADAELLAPRLEELSFLHPGVTFQLWDGRGTEPVVRTMHAADGLGDLVRRQMAGLQPAHPSVFRVVTSGAIAVSVALKWAEGDQALVLSYVNDTHTAMGGTHFNGLWAGVARAVRVVAGEFGHPLAARQDRPRALVSAGAV